MGHYIALQPLPVGGDVIRVEGERVPEADDWDPRTRDQWVAAGALQYIADTGEEYHGPEPLTPMAVSDQPVAAADGPPVEPEGEDEPPEASEQSAGGPPAGSIPVVMEWVGDDPERAMEALVAEEDGPGRKTLISQLQEIIEQD